MENNIFHVGAVNSNAYLINDEKIAVIDGTAANCADEYIENIRKITDRVDYIIFNNTCPNCAGSFKKLLAAYPDIEVIATTAGIRNLKEIANCGFNEHLAKDGAELNIGNTTLKFLITPNLVSPDSMMVYADGILFSGNAFSSENGDITAYYKNKLSSFAPFVKTMTERIKSFNIQAIYPLAGEILTEEVEKAIEFYEKLSDIPPKTKTVILYCSKYGATAEMAEIIKDTLQENVQCVDAAKSGDISDIINSAAALIIGTPTINRNAPEEIWNAIAKLDLVTMKNTPYFVFGSYGWGGEAIQFVSNHLKILHLKQFDKPFGVMFNMSESDKENLTEYTKRFMNEVKMHSER